MNTKTELIEGLRAAYSMERALEIALQKLMAHPHTHLALHEQASRHCSATRQHAEALAACLKRLGSEESPQKAELAQCMELMKSLGTAFVRDERIKDVLTVFATEHFEIACHARLRTGAQHFGLLEIVRICDEILLAEKCMSKWLELNMPQITASFASTHAARHYESEEVTPVNRIAQWEFSQLEQNRTPFGVQLRRVTSATR